MNAPPSPSMSFSEHLDELQKRLLKCLGCLVLTGGLALIFYKPIYHFFLYPIHLAMNQYNLEHGTSLTMQSLRMGDSFLVSLKLCLLSALLLSLPVILYQAWAFITPGLVAHERKLLSRIFTAGSVLFLMGCFLAWSVVVPWAMTWFIAMDFHLGAQPSYAVGQNAPLVLQIMAVFGLAFETPLVMVALCWAGLVEPDQLRRSRRMVLFIIFIMAAILTPPDVFTQLVMAVCLVVLYEVGILVSASLTSNKDQISSSEDSP